MNKRAIYKKLRKRKNKHNWYYYFVRIVFDSSVSQEFIDSLWCWVFWDTAIYSPWKIIYVMTIKERYLKYDLSCIFKRMKEYNITWNFI